VAVSFIDGGNWGTWRKSPICRKSLTIFITQCCIEHTSSWAGFELTTLVVIGTVCTVSCKSNYHTTTTMTAPILCFVIIWILEVRKIKKWNRTIQKHRQLLPQVREKETNKTKTTQKTIKMSNTDPTKYGCEPMFSRRSSSSCYSYLSPAKCLVGDREKKRST
jgi:hypothetical protein